MASRALVRESRYKMTSHRRHDVMATESGIQNRRPDSFRLDAE